VTRRLALASAVAALAVAALVAGVGLALRGGEQEPEQHAAATPPPGALIEQVYRRLLAGRHGAAWDLLHPAHQAIVTRSRYIECGTAWTPSAKLRRFDVLEVFSDPIDVPLIPETTSQAVLYRVTVVSGGIPETLTATGHAVAVDGRWRWVLAGPDVGRFEQGECPS
jgi:hypothetical protein